MWRRGRLVLQAHPRPRAFSSESSARNAIAIQNLMSNGSEKMELWPKFMEAPVGAVSGFLDTVHSATGAPWWMVLAGSTVAMRTALFPLTVYEVKKTSKLLQNLAKLPKPFVMPGRGTSILQQLKLFNDKRKELALPTPLWFLAPFALQMPLFITWIVTIRFMAINGYPGLDTGGALWFKDLTAPIDGFPGVLFPITIAASFITNLEIALKGVGKNPGFFGKWITVYRWWLRACTVPILMSGFYLPQGVYMYWLPNSLFSLGQTLVLRSRPTRKFLGLRVMPIMPEVAAKDSKSDSSALVKLAAEHFSFNNINAAVECLQLAIQKEPDDASIYYSLGNIHSGSGQFAKAAEAHTIALSKVNDDDELKMSVSLALGIALFNQGKTFDGLSVLRSVGDMEVPLEGMPRKKYYMVLVTLGSMLSKIGQKAEALECFQRVAEYDPKMNDLLVKPMQLELEKLNQSGI